MSRFVTGDNGNSDCAEESRRPPPPCTSPAPLGSMAACAEELVPLVTTPLIGAGLSLEVVPVLGRVVVATRPFSLGELVMCEQPLCVFDSNDDASYLRAYQSASETTRAKILDMVHPPLDKDENALVVQHRAAAARYDGKPVHGKGNATCGRTRHLGNAPLVALSKVLRSPV